MRIPIIILVIITPLLFQGWLLKIKTVTKPNNNQTSQNVNACDIEDIYVGNIEPVDSIFSHIPGIGAAGRDSYNEIITISSKKNTTQHAAFKIKNDGSSKITTTNTNSFRITANLLNKSNRKCAMNITLLAPAFDYNPKEKTPIVTLDKNERKSLDWVLIAKNPGLHTIVVTTPYSAISEQFEIVNFWGLTLRQASVISIIIGFLGSAFSLPWLFDKITQRKTNSR